MSLSKTNMSPCDMQDNELEFWGIQYFYEFYGKMYDHDINTVKQKLAERFNIEQLEQFYKWQQRKFRIPEDLNR